MIDPGIEGAHLFVRGHSTFDMRFEEHLRDVRYVVDPASGQLIAPVMVAMLTSGDTVLFVPGYEDRAMELMVTLEEFKDSGEDGALCDRWRIYHGDPPDVRWARMDIDAVRFEGNVLDGEPLMRPNPLAADEPRLCRLLNTDGREGLAAACREFKIDVEDPRAVGVDSWGVDVRRRFDVVRLHFQTPVETIDAAQAALDTMCRPAGGETT